jgi:TPP-dependent pyruvate/acetoin dehydrogenase alpha subunit
MKSIKKKYSSILQNIIKSRKFQIEINKKILSKEISVPVHLAFGHEFVSALVYKYFNKEKDKIILTHRNIHFSSIFSKNVIEKYSRLCKKKYNLRIRGSMNFTDSESGIIYTSSILGNNLSVATGVAKTLKDKGGYCVCVTGDGAIEEGSFYESLTLSRFLKLPIIFLLENNDWSMATTINQRRSRINLSLLAKSLNIKYHYFPIKNLKKNIKTFENIAKNLRANSFPVICEFEVITIGEKKISKKLNKYHHGSVKLDLIDDFFIYPKRDDIVWKAINTLK